MANIGYSKVFLLDKYFAELQKFQKTENVTDSTNSSTTNAAAAAMMLLRRNGSKTTDFKQATSVPPATGPRENYNNKPLPSTPPDYVNMPEPTVEDLVRLKGPLTEDLVLKCLQRRAEEGSNHITLGPILLLFNQASDKLNPIKLLVKDTFRQLTETGCPQTIILSGFSGSGKTHNMMLIIKELFDGQGEAYRHLMATLTVVVGMGSARTKCNNDSSRIGHYVDIQVTDKTLTRARVHCYFLDQSRLINRCRPPTDSNYKIFYWLLAGLSEEERSGLFLHNVQKLKILGDNSQVETGDEKKFNEWRKCLALLGIPFSEVVRVLSAVLLLGNLEFLNNSQNQSDECWGKNENTKLLQQIACLLGVSESSLKLGLTSRTTSSHNQLIHSRCDSNYSLQTTHSLAKSLYVRTFATIVRRANSLRKLRGVEGTFSSDSTDSRLQADVISQHASTVGTAGSRASKSMAALNNAVKHVTDNSIGILDLFGFEEGQPSQLEQMCVNLSAETLQHFYNTHIFKGAIDACTEEGIDTSGFVYADNVPCIDLISSLRTGLLSLLDSECSLPSSSVETYVQKVEVQHSTNPRIILNDLSRRSFIIRHFAGPIRYDVTEFPETNRDILPDDVVSIFHKHHCSFGFASHLFTSELKILGAGGIEPSPKGINFRISPSYSSSSSATAAELLATTKTPLTTLTQDFHTRLDNLLRTLVHAKPHFIRCLRLHSSSSSSPQLNFDRHLLTKQLRAFQVLETLNLFVHGLPNRLRLKTFWSRYGGKGDVMEEDCRRFLERRFSSGWAIGRKHVFLNELNRQQLESSRLKSRHQAATLIQARWRGWNVRHKRLNTIKQTTNIVSTASIVSNKNTNNRRPQPISGTPPLDSIDGLVEKTCQIFGLDMSIAPPIPPQRSYTVNGTTKFGYPQLRVMRLPFPDAMQPVLQRKELVNVLGIAKPGHLLVEKKGTSIHVPFQYLEFGGGGGFKEGVVK